MVQDAGIDLLHASFVAFRFANAATPQLLIPGPLVGDSEPGPRHFCCVRNVDDDGNADLPFVRDADGNVNGNVSHVRNANDDLDADVPFGCNADDPVNIDVPFGVIIVNFGLSNPCFGRVCGSRTFCSSSVFSNRCPSSSFLGSSFL